MYHCVKDTDKPRAKTNRSLHFAEAEYLKRSQKYENKSRDAVIRLYINVGGNCTASLSGMSEAWAVSTLALQRPGIGWASSPSRWLHGNGINNAVGNLSASDYCSTARCTTSAPLQELRQDPRRDRGICLRQCKDFRHRRFASCRWVSISAFVVVARTGQVP